MWLKRDSDVIVTESTVSQSVYFLFGTLFIVPSVNLFLKNYFKNAKIQLVRLKLFSWIEKCFKLIKRKKSRPKHAPNFVRNTSKLEKNIDSSYPSGPFYPKLRYPHPWVARTTNDIRVFKKDCIGGNCLVVMVIFSLFIRCIIQ